MRCLLERVIEELDPLSDLNDTRRVTTAELGLSTRDSNRHCEAPTRGTRVRLPTCSRFEPALQEGKNAKRRSI